MANGPIRRETTISHLSRLPGSVGGLPFKMTGFVTKEQAIRQP
jgi:hypothetical protein